MEHSILLGPGVKVVISPTDLRPDRIAEIMRLQTENASLRAAYAELEARYFAYIKQSATLVYVAPKQIPANALRHSA